MPYDRVLTTRQETFCNLIADGIYTNTEAARRAGFSHNGASVMARKLLDGINHPHVVQRIAEIREERQKKYGVTLNGQLERLYELSRGAEGSGQFAAAINAEKVRSALGGLTIDRRETINTLDQLSRDEITARLSKLAADYPQAFALAQGMKDVTPHGTRSKTLEVNQIEDAQQLDSDPD